MHDIGQRLADCSSVGLALLSPQMNHSKSQDGGNSEPDFGVHLIEDLDVYSVISASSNTSPGSDVDLPDKGSQRSPNLAHCPL